MSDSSVQYRCARCGELMTLKDLDFRGEQIKCIFCGYRAIQKVKPPVVKRISSD